MYTEVYKEYTKCIVKVYKNILNVNVYWKYTRNILNVYWKYTKM